MIFIFSAKFARREGGREGKRLAKDYDRRGRGEKGKRRRVRRVNVAEAACCWWWRLAERRRQWCRPVARWR